jgi:hypothetical protein
LYQTPFKGLKNPKLKTSFAMYFLDFLFFLRNIYEIIACELNIRRPNYPAINELARSGLC